jgi:glutathione S-transferase
MSTPTYTLYYFDSRGRAESIRLLLAYAGVPFEDKGLKGEVWHAEYKASSPLGQMPYVIEQGPDGDLAIPQTGAIHRHFARVYGLYGASEREHVAADVAYDTALDVRSAMSSFRFGPTWGDEAARAKFLSETLVRGFDRLAKLLGDRAFFAAATPTFADIFAFDTLDVHLQLWPDCLAGFPTLRAFFERVRALPTLQNHLASRRAA